MYRESHYHSTTHECLGIFRGHAKLRFGVSNDDNPDDAIVLEVKSGDVIVVPAGVAHCALNESGEFCMVGAYPEVPPASLFLICCSQYSLFSSLFVLLFFQLVCCPPVFLRCLVFCAGICPNICLFDGIVCVWRRF